MPALHLVKIFLLRRNYAGVATGCARSAQARRRRANYNASGPGGEQERQASGQHSHPRRFGRSLGSSRYCGSDFYEDNTLASRNELSAFLLSVERRAYKQAKFAVRDEQEALDIVQDAMLKLAEKYGANSATELPMLFQRILQNTIRDFYRRHKVRSAWVTQLSSMLLGRDGGDEADPLETLIPAAGASQPLAPAEHLEKSRLVSAIEGELQKLPPRQREAFLLRYWEELDVAATARAMGCSEGSVKTHCSRAAHALAAALRRKGVTIAS